MTVQREWSNEVLSQYLDGELEEGTRSVLSAELMHDHELRGRLGRLTRVDAVAVAALGAVEDEAPRISAVRSSMALVSVAALVAVVMLVAARWPGWSTSVEHGNGLVVQRENSDSGRGARVVFSIPTGPAAAVKKDAADESGDPVGPSRAKVVADRGRDVAEFLGQLDRCLVVGDVGGAVKLFGSADEGMRELGYRRMAEVGRSVGTVKRVLAGMPGVDRLAACKELMCAKRWRSVACMELASLRGDPGARDAVDAYLDELSGSAGYEPIAARVRSIRVTPGDARPGRGAL